MSGRGLASVVVALLVAAGLVGWLLSGVPQKRSADEVEHPPGLTLSRSSTTKAGEPEKSGTATASAREPLDEQTLQSLFPSQNIARCDAPEDLGSGRYRLGDATALIRDGETWVLGEASGEGPVRALGRWAGYIAWQDGACQWDAPEFVRLTGQVEPVGTYRVAGCPIGELVLTDAEGRFSVQVPLGQECAVRTVHVDGQATAMGRPVQVSAVADLQVTLTPPRVLDQVGGLLEMLRSSTEMLLAEERAELEALQALEASDATAEWLVALAQERVAFFESEVQAFDDPAQSDRILDDFITSQSN